MNIKTILKDYYGIATDQWVRLTPKITVIYLDQDANLYVDEDELYYFDTDLNMLKISKKYGYSNIVNIQAQGSYKPYVYIDMNKISGFVSTCVMGPMGTYYERPY